MPQGALELFAYWNGPAAPATDETVYLREEVGVGSKRGRQNQLTRFNAGTLNCALDNRKAPNQRRFDPDFAAGPLFGKLLPDTLVQLMLEYPYLPGVLTNPDFESGTTGWTALNCSLSIVTASPYLGKQNLRCTVTNGPSASTSGTTTNGSAAIVSTVGLFSAADVGSRIVGANIPADTFILSFTDTTHVTMTKNATAGATNTWTIYPDSGVRSSAVAAAPGNVVSSSFRFRDISGLPASVLPTWAITWYSDASGTTAISSTYLTNVGGIGPAAGWVRMGLGVPQTAPALTQSFRISCLVNSQMQAGAIFELDAVIADFASTLALTPMFTGYLDKLLQDGDDARDAFASLAATDLTKILGRRRLLHSGIRQALNNDVNNFGAAIRHGWAFDESSGASNAIDNLNANTVSPEGVPRNLRLLGTGISLGNASVIPLETDTCLKVTDQQSGAYYFDGGAGGPGADVGSVIEAWVAWQGGTGIPTDPYCWYMQWHPNAFNIPVVDWAIGCTNTGDVKFLAGAKAWTWNQTLTGFKMDGTINQVALVAPSPSGTAPQLVVNGVTYAASSGSAGGPATPGTPINMQVCGLPPGISGASVKVNGFIGLVQYLTIASTTTFDYATRYVAGNGWAAETTGNRMKRILSILGIDSSQVDTGYQIVPKPDPTKIVGQYVQQYFDLLQDAEAGRQFVNRSGQPRMINRRAAALTPYNTVQATFGNGIGEIPFSSARPVLDDQLIYTEALITRDGGGVAQRSLNAAGVTQYGYPSFQLTILCQNDAESAIYAEYITQLYGVASPPRRIEQVVWKPTDDNGWKELATREVGDLIAVRVRPPGIAGGTYVEYRVFVEGISLAGKKGSLTITYQVSGYGVQPGWFVLNDANLGKLNTGILGF